MMKFIFLLLSIILQCYTSRLFLEEYYFSKDKKNYFFIFFIILKAIVLTYSYNIVYSFILDLLLIYTLTSSYQYYRNERISSILVLFVTYQVIDILSLLGLSHFFVKTFDELLYSNTIFSYIYIFLPKYVSYALVKEVMIKEDFDFSINNIKHTLITLAPVILLILIYILSVFGFIFTSKSTLETNLLTLLIIFVTLQFVLGLYYLHNRKAKPVDNHQEVENMKSYSQKVMNQLNEIKQIRHDLDHQYHLLHVMITQKEYDKALTYLESLSDKTQKIGKHIQSKYPYLDSIINTKIDRMIALNTDIRLEVSDFTLGYLDELELSIVLANALDNAYEALLESSNRVFKLKLYNYHDHLLFIIQNTVKKDYEFNEEISSKSDKNNHGFGLKMIRKYVHKHHGSMSINIDKTFTLTLKIPTNRPI